MKYVENEFLVPCSTPVFTPPITQEFRRSSSNVEIMWREFFESFGLPCFFGEPASKEAVLRLEQSLQVTLPLELRDLLLEVDGVAVHPSFFDSIGEEDGEMQVVWTVTEIQHENQELRAQDDGLETAFAGLANFLFFASVPNGDFVGYAVAEGKIIAPQLVVMSHESYADRRIQFASVQEYLRILMEAFQ